MTIENARKLAREQLIAADIPGDMVDETVNALIQYYGVNTDSISKAIKILTTPFEGHETLMAELGQTNE